MLEQSKDGSQASAAADAIRALTLNNNNNKDAVREAWALPLLVKLLSSVRRCSDVLYVLFSLTNISSVTFCSCPVTS